MAARLTYLDEMVDGKALTVLEQPNVTNKFIIQICSFCLILMPKTWEYPAFPIVKIRQKKKKSQLKCIQKRYNNFFPLEKLRIKVVSQTLNPSPTSVGTEPHPLSCSVSPVVPFTSA